MRDAPNISLLSLQLNQLTIDAGVFIFHPTIANYPKAKFPGVVVFSEIYQGAFVCDTHHFPIILDFGSFFFRP